MGSRLHCAPPVVSWVEDVASVAFDVLFEDVVLGSDVPVVVDPVVVVVGIAVEDEDAALPLEVDPAALDPPAPGETSAEDGAQPRPNAKTTPA